MGILSKIFGSGGEAVATPIEAIGNVLDKLFTSKEEKLNFQEAMARLAQAPAIAQQEINKLEAQHRSAWVAGWRPAIGWVCAAGLLNVWLINPWIQWLTGMAGPSLPLDAMQEMVFAMLGMGVLRSVDKATGRSK
jgi:hypothetical protein